MANVKTAGNIDTGSPALEKKPKGEKCEQVETEYDDLILKEIPSQAAARVKLREFGIFTIKQLAVLKEKWLPLEGIEKVHVQRLIDEAAKYKKISQDDEEAIFKDVFDDDGREMFEKVV